MSLAQIQEHDQSMFPDRKNMKKHYDFYLNTTGVLHAGQLFLRIILDTPVPLQVGGAASTAPASAASAAR